MTEEPAKPKVKCFPVIEIFGPTIQGEGLVVGQRTLFVRFGLCDYKCKMCDSMHAVDPKQVAANAEWLTADEIFNRTLSMCRQNNCSWVTFSGGNPAIHDLGGLADTLRCLHIGVTVETQGTLCPEWLGYCDYVTVSPKGPGMGEKFEIDKFRSFMDTLRGHPGLCVKVVIFDARDLEFASMIAEMCPLVVSTDRFYLSLGNPYPTKTDQNNWSEELTTSINRYKTVVEDIKEYKSLCSARFLPQLHHWVWGNERGH